MKSIIKSLVIIVAVLFLNGCSSNFLPSFMGPKKVEIPISQIDTLLSQAYPVTKKASFGKLQILTATTLASELAKKIPIEAGFILYTFEIPEGIAGRITYEANLKLNMKKRAIYLSNLVPGNIEFSNRDLIEYVSDRAMKGLPKTVADSLMSIPIYKIPDNWSVNGIKSFTMERGKVIIYFK